jgi:integrating conjugative element protein (TIGR03755 family)
MNLRPLVFAAILSATALSTTLATPTAFAQNDRSSSTLYYKLGGHSPVNAGPNNNVLRIRLGLSAGVGLHYSCGKFDVKLMWANYLNEIKDLGDDILVAVQGAALAFVASLPMYFFERAQPGLANTLQTYYAKFQVAKDIAIKSCEAYERDWKNGKDPWSELQNLASSEYWKDAVSFGTTGSAGATGAASGDAMSIKKEIDQNPGIKGVEVFVGVKRGGKGQPPLRAIYDSTVVGYYQTLGLAINGPAIPAIFSNPSPLAKMWVVPDAAATWAVDVLGDRDIGSCNESDCALLADASGNLVSSGRGVRPGYGLKPKYAAATADIELKLNAMMNTTNIGPVGLAGVSAPNLQIKRAVIDKLQQAPKEDQPLLISRLAAEVALVRTVNQAETLINLLSTAKTTATYDMVKKELDDANSRLRAEISDLTDSVKRQRELIADTAKTIVDMMNNGANAQKPNSVYVPSAKPLSDGRIVP